ncbi:unnamed protein product [Ceratitis capitata]|uniref:(Mediterranean fruit fly) hypothetical protein n=1 Tax=Ceratitis capitata TaxID=7213 RepID=A0A811TYD2_CERCA|nr:unnamed protein product [Ceratitis capitata]
MRNNGSPPENYCEYQQRQASQDECQCNIVSSTTEDINTEQRSSAIVVRRPRGHAVSINELVAAVQRVANAYQERPPIQPLEVSPQNAYNIPDEIKNFIDGRLVFENGREMVVLGANYTKLRKSDLYGINWNISGTEITKIYYI